MHKGTTQAIFLKLNFKTQQLVSKKKKGNRSNCA